ncbi:MAG TPA: protein kinase [Gemmatimonadales bacterium]|jgi:serine/threonine-protein kinase
MTVNPSLSTALVDRYRIDRELGQGGMATVYLAEDLKHHRKVAIKVLRPELAAVIGADRFVREIQTIAALQHPHILGLIDSGEVNGTAYYVMPFVEGESLRDRLNREKQLPIPDAIRIATEAASALDYAHRHGVIHRDIKPENILLHDGQALVADFGIALAVSTAGGSRMTETGMSLGTPHYMSPEQAMGERTITARSDVYALGCVVYEMLAGDPPFTGSTAQAIVARVLTEAPRPITAQRHTVPPHVEAAVFTALEKLSADRFTSAAEFAAALNGKEVPTRTLAVSRSLAAEPRSRRGALYAILALNAVFLGLAAFGWLRRTPVAVTRQRVILWQHPVVRILTPGAERVSSQAAIAPDGSSIVFSDRSSDSTPLMRKLRDEVTPRPLAGTEGGFSPTFSPDGKWIAFFAADGRLRKIPVEGGGAITLSSDGDLTTPTVAWLDNGTLMYAGSSQEMRRVSANGGASTIVERDTTRVRRNVSTVSALPGSRGVLFTSCPGNCGISSAVYVFDFAADSSRQLVANAAGGWYSPTGHLLYTDRSGGLYAMGFNPKTLKLTSAAIPVIEDVLPGEFAISGSGSVLYSTTSGGSASELVWVSRDGTTQPIDSSWRADFQYPALSPDGKSLAVSLGDGSTTQIWIRRSDGTRQKLTQSGAVNWRPSWAADGRSLVYLSNMSGKGGTDDYDVYRMRVDGSTSPELLEHHSYGLWEAEVSRDQEWLVVRSDEPAGSAIRVKRLHGDTTLAPLVVGKGTTTLLSLSPDGHWLAYGSDETGRREIYVTPLPSGSSNQLLSREGGSEPRWAHSGRELFFKSGNQLMVVAITPGPTLVVGNPRPLFSLTGYRSARNRQQYDVAPDDQHFVMIRERTGGSAGNVVYVENWLEELKAKMKAQH